MTLIKMGSLKTVPSLPTMNALALKKIFDHKNMTPVEEKALEEGIEAWVRKVDLNVTERTELYHILDALEMDINGGYKYMKDMIARHKLDYRRLYNGGL